MKRVLSAALLGVCVSMVADLRAQTSQPSTQPTTQPATRPALVVPQQPGTHRLSTVVSHNGQKMKLPFVLYLPTSYQPTGPKTPALVFLHGSGESGTDLDAIFYHGPNFELRRTGNDAFRSAFPMIVISPQCPPRGQRWDQDQLNQFVHTLLDEVLPKLNVDTDRLYASGLSMGGTGTWHLSAARPNRFAAIVPISGMAVDPARNGPKLKNTAVLCITGQGDQAPIEGSKRMVAGLNSAGGFAQGVIGPDGHSVWVRAYARPRTYEWMLLHSKDRPLPSTRPSQEAGTAYPHQPGFHRMAYVATTDTARADAGHFLNYLLYLPADYTPADRRPLLIHLPDTRTFGVYRDGLVLHAPAQRAYDLRGSKSFPFILVQPMLPPFATLSENSRNEALAQLVQTLIAQYKPAEGQVYLAGSGDGAKIALTLARETGAPYAATVLDVCEGYPHFDEVHEDQPVPTTLLAVTTSDQGTIHDRLAALVNHATPGSELTLLPPEAQAASVFSTPEVYQRLLKIKGRVGQ